MTKSLLNGLSFASASEIKNAIASGEVSAVEVTQHFLGRIHRLDPKVGSFLHLNAEIALAQAAGVDAKRARGETLGALAGVPVALKDNLCMRGTKTTCASQILNGWISPYDAHVVTKLRQADSILLGKTNMDEFAMGSSNENSSYYPVKNPWDETRVPGGSSGGSAAAVAAGFAAISLGSDTGGSVRQPGSFTSTVAIKPTYGRVSRYGLVAFASSLDQIGPFARNVKDAALSLEILAGRDDHDATSADLPVETYSAECGKSVKGLRVGVLRSAIAGCDQDVQAAFAKSIEILEKLGCAIVDIELPSAEHAVSAYYILAPADCSSNLARFDGMRYGARLQGEGKNGGDLLNVYGETRAKGFGKEVKRRIMLGTYVLSAGYYDAFYAKAQKARTVMRNDYARAFEKCDVVLTPTSPTRPFKLGQKSDPLEMYLADIFTLPPSLAGLPAINVPASIENNLPFGIQFTAKAFDEATLVRIGHAFESEAGVSHQHPHAFIDGAKA